MATNRWLSATALVLLGGALGSRASDMGIRPDSEPTPGDAMANRVCVRQGEKIAQGHTLVLAGRYTEARTRLADALNDAEQRSSPDPVYRACIMGMLGFVDLQQSRPDRAAEWYRRALELEPLPDALSAALTNNLAHAYGNSDQLERAEEFARRAIPLLERAFGPESPELLFPRAILAHVHLRRGEYAVAEPVFRRILYLAERSWGSSSYGAAQAASNLADMYFLQGRHPRAKALYEKSLAGLQNHPMRAVHEIPLVQAGLAASCAASGSRREADVWVQQALAAEHDLGPQHPALPEILERAALTRFFQKNYEAGWQLYDRAIGLLAARYGAQSPEVVAGLERYMQLVRAAKDKTRARQLEARRKALVAKR